MIGKCGSLAGIRRWPAGKRRKLSVEPQNTAVTWRIPVSKRQKNAGIWFQLIRNLRSSGNKTRLFPLSRRHLAGIYPFAVGRDGAFHLIRLVRREAAEGRSSACLRFAASEAFN
jgi:hypothetical protein